MPKVCNMRVITIKPLEGFIGFTRECIAQLLQREIRIHNRHKIGAHGKWSIFPTQKAQGKLMHPTDVT
jgi:hypothetical protein